MRYLIIFLIITLVNVFLSEKKSSECNTDIISPCEFAIPLFIASNIPLSFSQIIVDSHLAAKPLEIDLLLRSSQITKYNGPDSLLELNQLSC